MTKESEAPSASQSSLDNNKMDQRNKNNKDNSNTTGGQSGTGAGQDDDGRKLFYTTTDLMGTMNRELQKLERPDDVLAPRFELQRRMPDGSTRPANESDVKAADMESKFKQAADEVNGLSPEKKMEWAALQRKSANELYEKKDYMEALDAYLTCLVIKMETPEFYKEVYLPVMNNMAQCALQIGSYTKAETFCSMALAEYDKLPKESPLIPKLFFRRGKARRLKGLYKLAREDLNRVLELACGDSDADNKERRIVEKELVLVKKAVSEGKKNRSRQQQAMKKLFDAKSDTAAQIILTGKVTGDDPSFPTAATTTIGDADGRVVNEHGSASQSSPSGSTSRSVPNPKRTSSRAPSGLYEDRQHTQRQYSALRAPDRPYGEELVQPKVTYWRYYIMMVGRVAERLLVLLGDEEYVNQANNGTATELEKKNN